MIVQENNEEKMKKKTKRRKFNLGYVLIMPFPPKCIR